MDSIIDKKLPFYAGLMRLPVMVCMLLLLFAGILAGAEDTSLGDRVTDPQGMASFMPPRGWIRWDFWGIAAFSPTSQHTPRITFSVTPGDFSDEDHADTAMRNYVSTFSNQNYVLIQKENLYLGGWSGIRILAQGTKRNTLYDQDYIWIQEYFTKHDKISLVFRCDPVSFETHKDTVLTSFRSLTIMGRRQDGL